MSTENELAYRAVRGLKHIGSFKRTCGEDPHPLDCSLAGRVCQVFGLGMTRAMELCVAAGEDPHWQSDPCEFFDSHDWDIDEEDEQAVCTRCGCMILVDAVRVKS